MHSAATVLAVSDCLLCSIISVRLQHHSSSLFDQQDAIMTDTEIIAIHAREILDSRGNPTVEADVILSGGAMGRAAVPSGASTGEHEAVELRDGDAERYLGKGVRQTVENIESEIARTLGGMDAINQRQIDSRMI